jgi:AcrR family transcriptional regulator
MSPPPITEYPPQGKTGRRDMIYHAAAVLFRNKGYAATGMREIAENVGLEVGSLYAHIRNKEAILHDICFKLAEEFILGLKDIENEAVDVATQLRHIIHLHVRLALLDVDEFVVFNEEWRNMSEEHVKAYLKMRRDYEQRLLRIIEIGIATGSLVAHEPRVILHTLLSAVRWVPMWYHEGRRIEATQLADYLTNVLLTGIKKNN